MNRREFLKTLGRLALLGLFAAGTTRLVTDRKITGGSSCTGGGICRGCGGLFRCGLPAALSFRQATGRKHSPEEHSPLRGDGRSGYER